RQRAKEFLQIRLPLRLGHRPCWTRRHHHGKQRQTKPSWHEFHRRNPITSPLTARFHSITTTVLQSGAGFILRAGFNRRSTVAVVASKLPIRPHTEPRPSGSVHYRPILESTLTGPSSPDSSGSLGPMPKAPPPRP